MHHPVSWSLQTSRSSWFKELSPFLSSFWVFFLHHGATTPSATARRPKLAPELPPNHSPLLSGVPRWRLAHVSLRSAIYQELVNSRSLPPHAHVFVLGSLTCSSVLVFIITLLLLSADFYYLKNIAGRRLVGLRWWNEVNTSTGDSHWVFESSDPNTRIITATDKRFFWLSLYAAPALWIGLAVLAIVRLSSVIWLSLVGESAIYLPQLKLGIVQHWGGFEIANTFQLSRLFWPLRTPWLSLAVTGSARPRHMLIGRSEVALWITSLEVCWAGSSSDGGFVWRNSILFGFYFSFCLSKWFSDFQEHTGSPSWPVLRTLGLVFILVSCQLLVRLEKRD